ncbi:succinylglutamate desuccinylase/aspartoacylase family protein [Mesorhizobium sp.]|uniref:succinylglutamate desuccinylase/aspartoacylase domain-containing protein n=1 Tax=Mesorhizobium sp. TaxID=1871066 RepID=UPI0012219232|nr:succinylglutamate desuccinylase/aspartoacylase family protein [Mesorhizobium sp.]TIN26406.1 MAG: succinylglutamate desuccinylase/aspartoacylase family protein [Mesorhizobium sp.]TIN35813.1 MAG: succinylglutamate desuccinylase/aspartoacylase family protein [Mesorhizobium sp.]TJU80173.1 MAG: succinylglutamate desuccinylase/aspartoacylase family protein [Mesorhizobium sp.]TJU84084.1 MAG: succinylglutamate desuccinylase/aspartoacylase family protein [Mesorhizobium sp.]
MQKSIERIAGDSEGVCYEFPVFRFEGTDRAASSAYLQAALHAGELPGVVAIDALMPMLEKAEAEGRIKGDITVVPQANPIGRAQYHFGEHQGRFHLGTRTNFNRGFPLLAAPDVKLLPDTTLGTADQRLKTRLLQLSIGHDIVLDLHCDDEGLAYLYVHASLWSAMADCAAAMGVDAVILWDEDTDGTFEGASIAPYLNLPAEVARFDRRVATTVEYRGILDVDGALAGADADGLYRLLVARGVILDQALSTPGSFTGIVAPLENIDMMPAPRAGAVLYNVKPGDRVAKGALLATIVHAPGEAGGRTQLFAPQAGIILTRRSRRIIRAGEDLLKLVGDSKSADARSGTLED